MVLSLEGYFSASMLKVRSSERSSTSKSNARRLSIKLLVTPRIVMGKHPGLDLPAGPIRIAQIYGVVAVLLFLLSNALIYRSLGRFPKRRISEGLSV